MISVNDVHKSYSAGKEIIKGVSFEVKDGMIRMPDGSLVKAEVRHAEGTTDTDPAEK